MGYIFHELCFFVTTPQFSPRWFLPHGQSGDTFRFAILCCCAGYLSEESWLSVPFTLLVRRLDGSRFTRCCTPSPRPSISSSQVRFFVAPSVHISFVSLLFSSRMSSSSPEYAPFFAVMGASAAMVFSGNYRTLSCFKAYYCMLSLYQIT